MLHCVRCVCLEDPSDDDNSDAARASRQLDRISDKFQPVATSTAELSTVFLSLIVWVAVITIVLAVIVVVTYRRRRRAASAALDNSDSISSCSVQLTH